MKVLRYVSLAGAAFLRLGECARIAVNPRSVEVTNSADDRSAWSESFDLSTNYYDEAPDTGVTREYWFEITNITAAPDGYQRVVLAVNGTVPGPTLFADWGDTVVVHVTNSLTNNGTSIHWHGIRQNHTNQEDGVVSITQCPLAPGESRTYTWRAVQYGTTWYHSHFALQTWEGVFGGIIINGPASSNYDEDLGVLFLGDWSHQTANEQYLSSQLNGPPTQDTGLINGTNVSDDGGARFQTTFKSGTKYRIRLINSAIETHFRFEIDGHNLTVIANDLVPIVPYTTQVLGIGIGQRYDIIVEATGDSNTNYWMRAVPSSECSVNNNSNDIRGIVRYEDADTSTDPTTSAYNNMDVRCVDEDPSNLVPYVSSTVGTDAAFSDDLAVTFARVNGLFRWYIGGTTMEVKWANPTLLQIEEGVSSWDNSSAVFQLTGQNLWAHVIIETVNPVPHPIHLHGHDFYILAQGNGTYADTRPTLQTNNPPRRDTAMLPSAGFLVIAFLSNNPGVWLMHCHIGFHTSEGFALQFIERYAEISALVDSELLNDTCSSWKTYQSLTGVDEREENESGV